MYINKSIAPLVLGNWFYGVIFNFTKELGNHLYAQIKMHLKNSTSSRSFTKPRGIQTHQMKILIFIVKEIEWWSA